MRVVFKTPLKTKNCYAKDVLKTSSRYVLWLHREIFDSPCFLILLIYTKHKTKRGNPGLNLHPHFASMKLRKCFQIPYTSPRVASTPNRTKINHHWLNHLQILYTHKLCHLPPDRSERKLFNHFFTLILFYFSFTIARKYK